MKAGYNRHGLDVSYNQHKLNQLVRDISNYRPDELARALLRLAVTADSGVLKEPEFSRYAAGPVREAMLKWAVGRWHDEVAGRHPDNPQRMPLDDAWRQVIRFCGGDPDVLLPSGVAEECSHD